MTKRRRARLTTGVEIKAGSGNVYKDLGFKDAEVMLAKARIVARQQGLTRSEARAYNVP